MAPSHEDRMKSLKSKRDAFKVKFVCLLDNYEEKNIRNEHSGIVRRFRRRIYLLH